jgi:alkylation response protein AidB-like acyl-CoA dehydrogenase
MIDFAITEEEQLLAETASRFGAEHLSGEREREHEAARAYPEALLSSFEEMGLAGINRAEMGLDASHRLAVWTALAAADTSAPYGLDPIGPGAAALEQVPDGTGIVLVAPGVTVADGRATGLIPWVPRRSLDWLVLIRDEGLFLIKEPGYETLASRPCGLQACGGLEVSLDGADCEQVGDAERAQMALDECRLLAGAVMLGGARDSHDAAAKYAQERVAFGKPIAHHQGLAFQLADAATDLDAAQLLLGGSIRDSGLVANAHAHACEVAMRVCERSVQVLGGHGYLYDHRVEKRMRDVRAVAALYGGAILSEHHASLAVFDLPDPLEFAS